LLKLNFKVLLSVEVFEIQEEVTQGKEA